MSFFNSPWFRFGLAGIFWFVGYMSFRMVRIYRGEVRSTTVDAGGGPTLIAISLRRGWVSYASVLPVLIAKWPALITYLLAIRLVAAAVWYFRARQGLPPLSGLLDGDGPTISRQQAGSVIVWGVLVLGSALWLGI